MIACRWPFKLALYIHVDKHTVQQAATLPRDVLETIERAGGKGKLQRGPEYSTRAAAAAAADLHTRSLIPLSALQQEACPVAAACQNLRCSRWKAVPVGGGRRERRAERQARAYGSAG